jgi:hypothetical protein
MATRETAAADSSVSGQRRCDRALAMALRGRDGETRVASKQIQRGREWAMETRATEIKAGRMRHKWAMVQATATVMYRKGSSFYNSIINKDGLWMLARRCDNDERQFELPPSLNTVSLRRISFFSEICSPWRVTSFFSKTPHFPLNQKNCPCGEAPLGLLHKKHSLRLKHTPHVITPHVSLKDMTRLYVLLKFQKTCLQEYTPYHHSSCFIKGHEKIVHIIRISKNMRNSPSRRILFFVAIPVR